MATLLDPTDPEVRAAIEAGRAMLEGLGARPFVEQLDAAVALAASRETDGVGRPGTLPAAPPRQDPVVAS